jgi:hypothetical protein
MAGILNVSKIKTFIDLRRLTSKVLFDAEKDAKNLNYFMPKFASRKNHSSS